MRILFILCFLISLSAFSQDNDAILADEYFKNGEFEKALLSYKKVYLKNNRNRAIFNQIIKTHQQLEQYSEAKDLLEAALLKGKSEKNYVELGYNYKLQNDTINANLNYQKALDLITVNPNLGSRVAAAFQSRSLLDNAVLAYKKALALKPDLSHYNIQLAKVYGEQGKVEKMFNSYINFAETNSKYIDISKRVFSTFISENRDNESNIILKKILLKKIQTAPNIIWNDMLSWLFIQQKEYKKAFTQEKAIYKRELESLDRIKELANIAYTQKKPEIAKDIFQFIIDNTQDIDTKINAHNNLIAIEIKQASKKDYTKINDKYLSLLNEFGNTKRTLYLQIAHAHFLAFYLNKTNDAISALKNSLKLNVSKYSLANIKLELGDILVLEEKFNEALIYYTQIQRSLKNSTVSQEARFKVAKTSYYKGDFKWAESQLKILKSSTSQLTANDALDLKLLIEDNKMEDSLQVALKKYAKADLLAFQNKKEDAIALLSTILKDHKTEAIVAQTLLKQAQLFEEQTQFDNAKNNYLRIILDFKDSILADDALFALAEIYANILEQPEEAKALYENIIFNHADSIYFVDARKKYRALRGDAIN